jgi:hypothetical protein
MAACPGERRCPTVCAYFASRGSRPTEHSEAAGQVIMPITVSAEVQARGCGHPRQRAGVEDVARALASRHHRPCSLGARFRTMATVRASLRGLHGFTCLLMRIPPFTMGPRGNEVPSEGVTEFGGWPQPPRWVWAVTAVAAGALLAGVAVARTGPHHGAAFSPAGRHSAHADGGGCAAAALGPGRMRTPADAPVLVPLPAGGAVRVLPGGTGPRRVVSGSLVFAPAPGLPDRGWLVQTWSPGWAPAASCCTTVYCGAP